ncbi:hypothetical protein [Dyadobacter sp. CY312]|uniref:hypothetical protein n=1 Tax=Dyadobacter sp. CY312 TaxID=2907303 RepID=UPI001F211A55|nr:hypothetical protein [Dyadobacter sp. CY312]MCE7044412.1 hypothetical protein [Dyadobacter sp. CY312]
MGVDRKAAMDVYPAGERTQKQVVRSSVTESVALLKIEMRIFIIALIGPIKVMIAFRNMADCEKVLFFGRCQCL